VTPVKDQGQCGSCWAFATTATIESLWAKKTSQMIDLSEEDLLDCAVTNGCNGATMDAGFSFVKNNGEAREAAAPYTATVLISYFLSFY
jgi:C1A family cysteine protease